MSGEFPERVYQVVMRIPRGKVTTYGRIGQALGSPRAARMVGWALNAAPANVDIPAHRVVNRNGQLSGAHHFGAPDVMRDLLVDEGVAFLNETTVDLSAHLWDPADDPDLDDLFHIPD
jgi:methylated-DNA-protein-cysteine methyltransferase related protein